MGSETRLMAARDMLLGEEGEGFALRTVCLIRLRVANPDDEFDTFIADYIEADTPLLRTLYRLWRYLWTLNDQDVVTLYRHFCDSSVWP